MQFRAGGHTESCSVPALPDPVPEAFVRVQGFGSLLGDDFVGTLDGVTGGGGICGVERL